MSQESSPLAQRIKAPDLYTDLTVQLQQQVAAEYAKGEAADDDKLYACILLINVCLFGRGSNDQRESFWMIIHTNYKTQDRHVECMGNKTVIYGKAITGGLGALGTAVIGIFLFGGALGGIHTAAMTSVMNWGTSITNIVMQSGQGLTGSAETLNEAEKQRWQHEKDTNKLHIDNQQGDNQQTSQSRSKAIEQKEQAERAKKEGWSAAFNAGRP